VTDDGTEPEVADLARRIENADRPSAPIEKRLRFQWNVPTGITPYIPFWFAMACLGTMLALVVVGVLNGM
jgi:hypothetical protein